MTVRLALLDSHLLLRDSLCSYLSDHGHQCVAVEGEPARFLEKLAEQPADLAVVEPVLDVRTLAIDAGLEVLQALKQRFAPVKVLVLTLAPGRESVDRCYQAGAHGYVYKPTATPQSLLEAIEAAARGERRFPVELMDGFTARVAQERPQLRAELAELTDREREVLAHIAAGHDNLKIGAMMGISERTVKSHVAAIYRKLRMENRVQLALRARELGLIPA